MTGGVRWWAGKIRQFRSHIGARVAPAERASLVTWLTRSQLALFDSMHVADRRHGLDVMAALRHERVGDPDVLLAGLLHDAGKGQVGVWPRVAYALGQAYGPAIGIAVGWLPGMRRDLARLAGHAASSAALAEGAGCAARTVALIRWQDEPRDPEFGEVLRLADDAN